MPRIAILSILFFCANAFAIDASLRPEPDSSATVAEVYRDMIVVQNKAKEKAGHWLGTIFEQVDFSDGPQQVFATNLGLGYALSDTWEVYGVVAPYFAEANRPIKNEVANLTLANGAQAALISPKPKFQYGIDILWLPAYGKDAWGPHHIVRSDTFFKLSIGNTQFEEGSGVRASLGLGKTFFLSRYFNPRITGSFGVHQTIVNGSKSMAQFGLLELAEVLYF